MPSPGGVLRASRVCFLFEWKASLARVHPMGSSWHAQSVPAPTGVVHGAPVCGWAVHASITHTTVHQTTAGAGGDRVITHLKSEKRLFRQILHTPVVVDIDTCTLGRTRRLCGNPFVLVPDLVKGRGLLAGTFIISEC